MAKKIVEERVDTNNDEVLIEARELSYQKLNELVRHYLSEGRQKIVLKNVNGQRYIGSGLDNQAQITIIGTPGNDLAAFSDGVEIEVLGNVQDGTGNTMNDGQLIIAGNAGDVLGYSMRGGEIYLEGDAGYRAGIHMKGFKDKIPEIIIGGNTGDFLGEYMAGGLLIVLGINRDQGDSIIGNYTGVGMHGGVMYVREKVDPKKTGPAVKIESLDIEDQNILEDRVKKFCRYFNHDFATIMAADFCKITPASNRPYGSMYVH